MFAYLLLFFNKLSKDQDKVSSQDPLPKRQQGIKQKIHERIIEKRRLNTRSLMSYKTFSHSEIGRNQKKKRNGGNNSKSISRKFLRAEE